MLENSRLDKVPYMIIVGGKEQDERCISVRKRDKGDIGKMKLGQFLYMIQLENKKVRLMPFCK